MILLLTRDDPVKPTEEVGGDLPLHPGQRSGPFGARGLISKMTQRPLPGAHFPGASDFAKVIFFSFGLLLRAFS